MEIIVDVYWSGKPTLKDDGTYNTNKTKLRISFNDIVQCNNKEIFSWDYINNVYIKYINLNNKEFLCFASDKEDPMLYIVCDSIEYEELINY